MAVDERALDNPIWQSLTTSHARLAEGRGVARRFPAAVTSLAGLSEQTPEAFDCLNGLVPPGEIAVLFLDPPLLPPAGWQVVESGPLFQMVQRSYVEYPHTFEIHELVERDVGQMMALAEATKPGPFGERTRELGTFLGIFDGGRLIAMIGERLRVPGFAEVSAVCTSPSHAGRGLASALLDAVVRRMRSCGETPFLHVRAANTGAVRVYERMGFSIRKVFDLAVLQAPARY